MQIWVALEVLPSAKAQSLSQAPGEDAGQHCHRGESRQPPSRPGMQTETLSHPSQTPSKPVVYPSAQATHCLGVFPRLLASSTPQVSSWCSEDSRSLQNRLLSPCAEHCSGFHPQWVTCSLPCVSAHGPCSTQVPQLHSQAISFPSPSPGAQTPHLLEWQDLASLSVRLCSLGTD